MTRTFHYRSLLDPHVSLWVSQWPKRAKVSQFDSFQSFWVIQWPAYLITGHSRTRISHYESLSHPHVSLWVTPSHACFIMGHSFTRMFHYGSLPDPHVSLWVTPSPACFIMGQPVTQKSESKSIWLISIILSYPVTRISHYGSLPYPHISLWVTLSPACFIMGHSFTRMFHYGSLLHPHVSLWVTPWPACLIMGHTFTRMFHYASLSHQHSLGKCNVLFISTRCICYYMPIFCCVCNFKFTTNSNRWRSILWKFYGFLHFIIIGFGNFLL